MANDALQRPTPLPSGQRVVTIESQSEDETRSLGKLLVAHLRGGELIGLHGELGAGKTVLVRGMAEGLGIAERKVRSPSFTLINEYGGGRLQLYHIDLYRMTPSENDRLALREYLYGSGVCVVEWFERLGETAAHLGINCTFVGEHERVFVVSAHGARYDALLDELRSE